MPNPNAVIVSPRDAASGQATGKRTHKPLRARMYSDQSIPVPGGRVVLLNTKTGDVEFGDATKETTPPTGEVPTDGFKMFLADGTPCRVKGGKLVMETAPKVAPKGGGTGAYVPR